jgi:hypothetical protein
MKKEGERTSGASNASEVSNVGKTVTSPSKASGAF